MHYRIAPVRPQAHIFEVRVTIPEPDREGQVLALPVWIPGSYMVREFARNILTIRAETNGRPVMLTKSDKQRWQAAPSPGPLTVIYEVYAWDLSVRAATLDLTRGYFNGTSVFLQVVGQEDKPCTVEIVPPPFAQQWRVATTLRRDGAEAYGFGRYIADNYDDLVDHPVELGEFTLGTFAVAGVPHEVVITGRHNADMARVCRDLEAICAAQVHMFGELPPMERYLFLVTVVGEGYGGLEHRSSCSLLCSRDDLPLPGRAEMTEEYRTFLGLCSHEYFHTWNVKRIKPAAFVPYDLSGENYTRQLWAFEGITAYYDDLMLVRSGRISAKQYLETLAQTVTRVWRGNGRFVQSVADSSFDAWIKFYRQDENAPNAVVSYYTKGSLIALALDLLIRKHTNSASSLDDVMCRLWRDFGKKGVGVPEGYIDQLAAEIAGVRLNDFFARCLYGTEDPPLEALLEYVGVEFRMRPAESSSDKGGQVSKKTTQGLATRPVLGARTSGENGGVKLQTVLTGSAAEKAGLAAGDVLMAINTLRTTPSNLDKLLGRFEVGQKVIAHAFRRDELMTFDVVLQAPPADTCELVWNEDVDPLTAARGAAWLRGNASS
ncbi:MAG: M61 family metallopeptidase [Gammaproteobacteria bacterium]|nr:M61 family metallopeptidase [Gammaproteobacteria bacterium]